MKKQLIGLGVAALMFGGVGSASATLTTIGYATFNNAPTDIQGPTHYNLIWDNDNNGDSVVWLDYTNDTQHGWLFHNTWASTLANALTLNIDSAYSVEWESDDWRLGSTVNDLNLSKGYNITTSEMGHLFYDELQNIGYHGSDGEVQTNYGLTNTGEFQHLIEDKYWSGTKLSGSSAWLFEMDLGYQSPPSANSIVGFGLALRTGEVAVTGATPTPEPATMLLFGTGLVGLIGSRIRKKKQ